MYCKRCGREIKTNAKFCPACGSPVGQTVSGGGNSNTNKKSFPLKKFGISRECGRESIQSRSVRRYRYVLQAAGTAVCGLYGRGLWMVFG